jgi:hypothetical protein
LLASILKISGTDIQQRLTELTLEAIGCYGNPYRPFAHDKATNEHVPGPDYAHGASAELFPDAAHVDLWRLERDAAEHHPRRWCSGSDAPDSSRPHRTGRPPDMDFPFTEEQNLLRNMRAEIRAERLLVRRAPRGHPQRGRLEAARTGRGSPSLGVLGAPFAEEHGGLGGGPVETMIIMEEFGRGLVVEPFLGTVVLAGRLPAPWWQQGAAGASTSRRCIEGKRVCALRLRRAAGALQPGRPRGDGEEAAVPATC